MVSFGMNLIHYSHTVYTEAKSYSIAVILVGLVSVKLYAEV